MVSFGETQFVLWQSGLANLIYSSATLRGNCDDELTPVLMVLLVVF